MAEDKRIIETPVQARAGFLDRPVLIVLTVSLILVIVLFAVGYFGVSGSG